MKRILIPALSAFLAFASTTGAATLSPWALEEYKNISAAGLIPESIISKKLTDEITREEFCDIIINLYEEISNKEAIVVKTPFWDTDSESVAKAYALGIVNGKTATRFYPNDTISRQEMAKMVTNAVNAADANAHVTLEEIEKMNVFEDFHETGDWASVPLATTVKYEIITGTSKNLLTPRGYATREQAVAIVNRAYEKFNEEKEYHALPETKIKDGEFLPSGFSFAWDSVNGATNYRIILKDANENLLKSYDTKNNWFTITDMVYNRRYYVTVGAKTADGDYVYGEPKEVFFGVLPSALNIPATLWEKQLRTFAGGSAYTTQEEAEKNMKTISFPVWRLREDGTKYSDVEWLVVNKNIADDVIKVFVNIYHSDEKFPIKNVGGYSWRKTAFGSVSQHSYGTCIDINYDENYYCHNDGTAITGSFWLPYQNPYSMPSDGSVVTEFKKFGFTWGGDWKNLKDYMHFSYLGK